MPFSVEMRCGHCKQRHHMPFTFAAEYNRRNLNFNALGKDRARTMNVRHLDEDDEVRGYATALCPNCGAPNLYDFTTKRRTLPNVIEAIKADHGLFGGSSVVSIKAAYPEPPHIDVTRGWPEKIADVYKSCLRMQGDDDVLPAIIISSCRSMLDVATRELGASNGNLYQRIDALRERGVLTQALTDWAHVLRVEGNLAIHEIEGDRESAAELLAFVRLFCNVAFTLPADIRERSPQQ